LGRGAEQEEVTQKIGGGGECGKEQIERMTALLFVRTRRRSSSHLRGNCVDKDQTPERCVIHGFFGDGQEGKKGWREEVSKKRGQPSCGSKKNQHGGGAASRRKPSTK